MFARKTRRSANPVRNAAVESLETRQLMSAYVMDTSSLKVICGDGNDVVKITRDASKIHVNENGVVTSFDIASIKWIHVMAKGGNDNISIASNITINADIDGGTGSDVLVGGAGNDTLKGWTGNDILDGGLGSDWFYGSDGQDVVTYASRTTPIVANLNTSALNKDDGAAGEGDVIYEGIEEVRGGSANDTFNAGDKTIRFVGNAGNDVFNASTAIMIANGGDGNDILNGGTNNDTLIGGNGNDMIFGKAGDDMIYGDAGDDFMDGGDGNDRIAGSFGNDTVAYHTRTANLNISLDGNADDGALDAAGNRVELDNVMPDVETVLGGSGNDRIVGSIGDNRLFGNGGHDVLLGGLGNDLLDGGEGNDTLAAGGGTGKDTLLGGNGDDTLSAIGGGADSVLGQGGNDIFWVDTLDTTDATATESSAGRLIKVSSYANGAGLTPVGEDLTDPSLSGLSDRNAVYGRTFSNMALFNVSGPKIDDVDQNNLGTCWFMAAIAGIAKNKPDLIRTSVAELGDGTYVVRLYSGTTAKFYRVDGQLPVVTSNPNMAAFAAPRNGSIWAPILEKAMALHRTSGGTYKAAEGGLGTQAFAMFNKGNDYWGTIWHSENAMATKMRDVLAAGGAVTVGSDPARYVSSVEPSHAYTVVSISSDLKKITIRNPWAVDGPGTNDSVNDGYITMTMTQFDDDFSTIYWSLLK
jgi:Ca2+-binding RTX toxin-like protein